MDLLPDRHHRTGRPVVAVLCKGRLVDDDPLVAAATADHFVVERPKIQTAACPQPNERRFSAFLDQRGRLFCEIKVNLLREHVLWRDPRARHARDEPFGNPSLGEFGFPKTSSAA